MKRILPLLLPLMLLAACSGEHFITDPAVRKGVRADFVRRQQSYGGALKPFLTLPENLSVSEREAMEFLYAYMPLADVAGGDGLGCAGGTVPPFRPAGPCQQ